MSEVTMVKKEIELPKEQLELVMAVVEILKAAKVACKDGFQPGLDLPVILTVGMQQLMVAVDGISKVGDEVKASPEKLALLAGVLAEELISAFKK